MACQSPSHLDAAAPAAVGCNQLEHVGAGVEGDQQRQQHPFGQPRILQQRPDHTKVRIAAQLSLERRRGAPRQSDAFSHGKARQPLEDPRLGQSANLRRHTGVERHLEVVPPEQGGDRTGCQHQRGSRVASDFTADLVGREQPRHLPDQRDDLGPGVRVPQHPQREIRLERG